MLPSELDTGSRELIGEGTVGQVRSPQTRWIKGERIFNELMTSDRKLTASREGSKWRIYELQRRLQHWSKLTVLVRKVNLHHRAYCPSGRWRSNPSGKFSQEQLTRGTVTGTMRGAAHPSGCARCGAGAGCSAMKCQSLPLQTAKKLTERRILVEHPIEDLLRETEKRARNHSIRTTSPST